MVDRWETLTWRPWRVVPALRIVAPELSRTVWAPVTEPGTGVTRMPCDVNSVGCTIRTPVVPVGEPTEKFSWIIFY